MTIAVSPLAPKSFAQLPPIEGVRFATAQAGFRYRGRTDLLLIALPEETQAAGVFTRSKCPSAPVDWCRDVIGRGAARAVVVNSGNANAFTGEAGRLTVRDVAVKTAALLGCAPDDVLQASTGVIGEPLDPAKFDAPLAEAAGRLKSGPWLDAAKAIMTTDTFPKVASARAKLGGVDVTVNGIAKGSGMIAPDMATMLAFLFTDAPIAAPVLHKMLEKLTQKSFNAITVDSDTSTSDTALLFATGAAQARGAPFIESASDRRLAGFKRALAEVMRDLAWQIIRDGEGARHFVAVTVEGATSAASAKRIALSIANSPLVKTAVAGEDANWGRIVAAIGKAGEPADRDKIAIWFGAIRVAAAGRRDPSYDEAAVSAYMRSDEIDIKADLGLGSGRFTVWTCDLTKAYVEINGDYRS